MPTWDNVLQEINDETRLQQKNNPLDIIRRKYLNNLADLTGRNTICYYSAWLTKSFPETSQTLSINDEDTNGFMQAISSFSKESRQKGLDLVLHTPGGSVSATHSIMDYLLDMYNNDIRVFVPQLAMSGGTVMACCSKEIYMGNQSRLGPIDPQIYTDGEFTPSKAILHEFHQIKEEVNNNPGSLHVYQFILNKIKPGFLNQCQKSIEQSERYTKEKLVKVMGLEEKVAKDATKKLSDFDNHGSHDKHISMDIAKEYGLKIAKLEENQDLQDLILTVHHCYMHTFNITNTIKAIENNMGKGVFRQYNIN